jgi:hypothetical protein
VEDRTQEWLHKTRMLDRKHAIRGGVVPDSAVIRQTSLTVIGAIAVMAILLISPLRLSDPPVPKPRIQPGAESRVQIDPNSPAGRALTAARAVLPVLPPIVAENHVPSVPPAVSIWSAPRFPAGLRLTAPSGLPPA